jgi:hypothetical protein
MLILGEQKHDEAVRDLKRMAREDEEIQGCGLELSDDFLSSFVRGKNGDQKKALKTVKVQKVFTKCTFPQFLSFSSETNLRLFSFLLNCTTAQAIR